MPMGKTQIPVPVNGKTYYGCREMCVGKLTNDETARIELDPFSKKPVDKTGSLYCGNKSRRRCSLF